MYGQIPSLSRKNLTEKSPSIKGFRASSTVSRGDSLPLPRHVRVRILNLAALLEQLEYTIKNSSVKGKNAEIPSTCLKRPV
jgi:hypothetical protein